MNTCELCPRVTDPVRWGLRTDLLDRLVDDLHAHWRRYRACFRSKTRDTSAYAYHYLRGQLRMTTKRTIAGIARTEGVRIDNLHHFISNAPWDATAVYRQIQQEIASTPNLTTGGVLILDESADAKHGTVTAGAGRQWNGRLGKVDLSQVGVMLAFAHPQIGWTWVDGDLFLPESWFAPEAQDARTRVGVPPERTFATKVTIGWQLIQRVMAQGLPFAVLACDDLYGRSQQFRHDVDQAGIVYAADIPATYEVFLHPQDAEQPPAVRVKGRRTRHPGVQLVQAVAQRADTDWQPLTVRTTERGVLCDRFAWRRVWTRRDGKTLAEEWLVMRQEGRTISYLLSNAPADTTGERLAWMKCQRYAVETSNRDAKSELGWADLQAQSYGAWQHHLALTVLASWFIAQTKARWQTQAAVDPTLCDNLGVDVLPTLSVANVRELLRAVLPLPQWSREEAQALVVSHLLNRTRSRKSRLKRQHRPPP